MSLGAGQRVVCVRDDWEVSPDVDPDLIELARRSRPKKGSVYEIVGLHDYSPWAPLYFSLAGFHPRLSYQADHFRPIIDAEVEKLAELAANPPPLAEPVERERARACAPSLTPAPLPDGRGVFGGR